MADRPSRFRWLLPAALIGLGVLALAAVGLWLLLPAIAGRVITDRLVAMGVPDPQVTVARIGYGRAVAVNLAAGAAHELSADEIVVDYRFADLLEGELESVTIRNPALTASIGPGGLSLGSLDPLLRGDGGGAMPDLPPITIEGATVDLATGLGTVTLTGSGVVTDDGGAISAELDLQAAAPQGSARGALSIGVAGADVTARLLLDDSRIALPDLLTMTATGELTAKLAGGEIVALEGRLALADLLASDPRAAALGPLAGTLGIARAADLWQGTLALADPAKSLDLSVRLAAPALAPEEQVTVALDLDAAAAAPLWPMIGLPQPAAGNVSVQLVGKIIPAQLVDAGGTTLPPLAGSLALELDGIALDGAARSISATAGLDIDSANGIVLLTAAAPILAEAVLDPALLSGSGLPPDAAALLTQPLAASVDFESPLRIGLGDETTITGSPAVTVDLADGRRLLDIGGTMELVAGAGLTVRLTSLDGRLDIPDGIGLPAAVISLRGAASIIDGGGTGEIALAATAPDLTIGGLRTTDMRLDLPLALDYGNGRLAARLAGKGSVSAARLRGTAPLQLAGPVQLPFMPGDVPLLIMELAEPEGLHAAIDLTAGPLRLAGSIEAEHGPIESTLSMPRIVLRADLADGGWSGKVTAADGELDIPTYAIVATDLDLSAELPVGGAAQLALAASVTQRGEPALVVPLSASLTARQTKGGWAFTGRATDAFKRISIDIEGRHDLARNSGSGMLRVAPIEFAPNVRQPEDLAPFLAGVAREVSGTIALAGGLSWSSGGIGSDLELLLRNVSATTDAAVIDRLNGVIAVDGLSPFSTKPGQTVAVAAIDAGLPLTDGLLTFRISPGGRLEIADGQLHLAGGTVNLEPLTFDPSSDSNSAVLAVTGVELGQLLALAQVDGLTGSGRLTGRIPVRVGGGEVVIEDGQLEAEAPGSLSYAPLTPPAALQGQGETVSLALSALTNFQYQQLRLTIDRQAGGEMSVGMHVRGNNPGFYDGYPVEFNLNVSGALDRVLRQSLAGYRIPAAIEEQLQEFAE